VRLAANAWRIFAPSGHQQIRVSSAVLDLVSAMLVCGKITPNVASAAPGTALATSRTVPSAQLSAPKDQNRQDSAADRQRFLNAKRRY
jgi:hypothetical protein